MHLFSYARNPLRWIDPYGLARFSDRVAGRPTPDQQAVISLAQEQEKRAAREARGCGGVATPLSTSEADALIGLANEQNVPVRAKPNDLAGTHGFGPVAPTPHIHINGRHVVVPPGYSPPTGSTYVSTHGPVTAP